MNTNRIYVTVKAEFLADGRLLPKSFIWEGSREYRVERVKDKRRATNTKAGGVGERYTCMVEGKAVHLY